MSLRNRVGLFGGTFNPIHFGHLRVAEEALRQFSLSRVLFLPTGYPPHKQIAEGVPGELRYEMVRLSIRGRPEFSVSRYELENNPAYTVDTIATMASRFPQGVVYIVGADILSQIEIWRDPERLLRSCPFIVAPRNGIDLALFRRPPFTNAELHFLAMDEITISSSDIRRYYRDGLPTEGLVPEAVDRFIREHGLYGVANRNKAR